MTTKGDIINKAYSRMKISGLTVSPTPEDNDLALDRLESMADELLGNDIDVGYFFEETPAFNTPHNMPRRYWSAFESNLAARLASDFGKSIPGSLAALANGGMSYLHARTVPIRELQYPARQPTGRGNLRRINRFYRYYNPQAQVPLSAESVTMFIDDIDDFKEDFESYLRDAETISSFTINSDTGLTIISSSLTSPVIDYRIRADGTSGDGNDEFLQVKIVATSSLGRKLTRFINFELLDSDL